MWPRIRYPFQRDAAWYARTNRKAVLYRFGLMATFFLHTKKEGKDVSRGEPLGTPGWFCRFSLYENRLERRHPNRPK